MFAGSDFAWAGPAQAGNRLEAWTGGAKPPLNLQTVDQHPFTLQRTAGRVVVLHFFATWCEPCRHEIPALNRLVERTARNELEVVTVSVAEPGPRVRSFMDKFAVNFPVLLDQDRSAARGWDVTALPTTFVLDGNLQPRLFIETDYDWDKFNAANAFDTTTTTITQGGLK